MGTMVENFMRFLTEDYFKSVEFLATIMPIIVYWAYSGFYMMLGSLDQYRIHTRKDEESKNLVSKVEVIRGVLVQQTVQTTIGIIFVAFTGTHAKGGDAPSASLIVQARQFFLAMVISDAYQYFVHRYLHANKFLYRHFHETHHKLFVPYAFGALYNHPVGAMLDTVGAGLAMFITGMSPWTSMFFFCFSVMKTIDDHCGLLLPGNPFHMMFLNNSTFHDSHHQLFGNKYNFGQPFFLWWDKLFGTYMPYTVEKREGGGYDVKPAKDAMD